MSDELKMRNDWDPQPPPLAVGGNGGQGNGHKLAAHARDPEVVAQLAIDLLRGTTQWMYFCVLGTLVSLVVTFYWLYHTDELVQAWKGFMVIALLFCAFSIAAWSKHMRDRFGAELLERHTPGSSYHDPGRTEFMMGSPAYHMVTLLGLGISVMFLFAGPYFFPLKDPQTRWMLIVLFLGILSLTFASAKQTRDAADADLLLTMLRKAR